MATQTIVPVIDMTGFLHGNAADKADIARQFGAAFEQVGFAAIVGHGVPETLAQEMYAQASNFFARPFAEKVAHMPPEAAKGRGYLPLGIESVAATLAGETPPDLCEALVFGSLQRERAGLGKANIWPTEPAALSPCVNAWFDAMHALCGQLMRMSALALDLPEDHFESSFTEPSLTLRFVNYPDQIEPPAAGQLRYGAHHDYGGLTILRQDPAQGGLQICRRDDNGNDTWHDVPAIPGSFVINAGDLMARWTNDRWRSTLHRVSNPPRHLSGSTRRLSMVAFTGPNDATEVRCLPTCRSADAPPLYQPVLAGDYIRQKLAASMDIGKAA
ncbi:2-oxoglutarate and iron-dependent oxygenase domain-containing protein [Uliginosibacterium sp. H3]|uniref:2-oxoglutarate-dependent ethylene/succinate-forming enzyme n=1 Tax=Uliginosibacterium silvisoli TaxID=3114758 RepID=A0ABU6K3V7_9RHOO|nr:2-oxoglutarate and iron-dependent oxygenase domain-containing protein [Uliginosibacterium sp. H3]